MDCSSHKVVPNTAGFYDKGHHTGERYIPATALLIAECKDLVVATADYANSLRKKIKSIAPERVQYSLDRDVMAGIPSRYATYIAERGK